MPLYLFPKTKYRADVHQQYGQSESAWRETIASDAILLVTAILRHEEPTRERDYIA